MFREKSYSKGHHHHTQDSPTKPCWKVKDRNKLHHTANNRIKPPTKDKHHISSFFGPYGGQSYYTNRTHFRYLCWVYNTRYIKLNLIAAKGSFGSVGWKYHS
jgi:hypothetical protein